MSDDPRPKGNEHSFPADKPVPITPSVDPIDPVRPLPTPDAIERKLDPTSGQPDQPKGNSPLFARAKGDGGLSSFERMTVGLGKWGLVIAALSLFAASVAAYLVFQQFKEMAAQTEVLSRAALQSRKDSAESSIATEKQLAALQAQITAAQNGASALQGQMKEAQRAADIAARELELADRAWIAITDVKPRGNMPIIPALSYEGLNIPGNSAKMQAFLHFEFQAKNVGRSTALNVRVVPHLYLAQWRGGDGYGANFKTEEMKLCKWGDKSSAVKAAGSPLYADKPYVADMGAPGYITQEATNFFSDKSPTGPYIIPVLIGCAVYDYQSSRTHHHVGFVYQILHAQGPRTRFFLAGQGVKADDLLLIRDESDDYVD